MTTAATPAQGQQQRTGRFQPATRKKSKLRLALDGPAGSGKTCTLLRFAFALAAQAGANGTPGRVAVIDSEHGSASKYQGDAPDGVPWNFDAVDLHTFSPTEYTAMIEEAGRAGYDVLVIDGLTQAWQGADGALELVNKKGGNSFTAWKDVTPMHNRMIEAILSAPMHVLVSMRSKVEYVLEMNSAGKQEPRKIGMAPIQRAGMEYEFDIYGSLDWSHVLTITKSRCPSVDGQIVVKPGPAFLDPVIRWLDTGEVVKPRQVVSTLVDDPAVERIVNKVLGLGRTLEFAKKDIFRRYTASEFCHLTAAQAMDYEKRLDIDMRNRSAATVAANGQPTASATAPESTAPTATPPTSPPAQQQQQPQNGDGRDADASGPMLDDHRSTIESMVAQLGMKPVDVRKLVRDVGCKQGAVKKLTQQQAADVVSRLTGQLVSGTPAAADAGGTPEGQTLQEALAAGQAAGNAAMAEPPAPNDSPHTVAGNGTLPATPNAYAGLDNNPVQFISTAWEELALLAGWTAETKTAHFAGALARRGVHALRDMTAEQLAEFKQNLVEKIKAVYRERGDVAACPFPLTDA